MSPSQFVMHEKEYARLNVVCERLVREANAKVVFLGDKNGQFMACTGQTRDLDTTSLASLVAGQIAAAGGIARLIDEKEFTQIYHEGRRDNIHISIVSGRVILVVIFDNRAQLGLVRLRVKKASEELSRIVEDMVRQSEAPGATPFAEITDDDIDKLFSE